MTQVTSTLGGMGHQGFIALRHLKDNKLENNETALILHIIFWPNSSQSWGQLHNKNFIVPNELKKKVFTLAVRAEYPS